MAFPTTPEETLKYFLFKVMSEEDATRFMSLKEVLAACEAQEPKWQAVYALTVHFHVIGRFSDLAEFTYQQECQITQEQVNQIVSKFLDSFSKAKEQHGLFLIILLYSQYVFCLKKGEEKEKINLINPVIEFEISQQGYPFVGYGKLLAANMLIPILVKEGDYKDAVGAMTKVAECLPTEDVFTQLDQLVDNRLIQLEGIPVGQYTELGHLEVPYSDSMNEDSPENELANFLDSVAHICELCKNIVEEETKTNTLASYSLEKLNKTTVQYWAWKLGCIVGYLVLKDKFVRNNLHDMCAWGYNTWPNGTVIASLLVNDISNRDRKVILDRLFAMWLFHSTSKDENLHLTNASPTNDLFWAMRIGFAEAMQGRAVAIVPQISLTVKEPQIGTALTYADLRQLKDHETLNTKLDTVLEVLKLLPDRDAEQYKAMFAWPQDMEPFLQENLTANTFASLPKPVQELLKDAEAYYRSKNRPWAPNMSLSIAIEGTFNEFFLTDLNKHYGQKWVNQHFSSYNTQLSKWGSYFCKLCSKALKSGEPNITSFLLTQYRYMDFKKLHELGNTMVKEAATKKNLIGHFNYQDKLLAFLELRELTIVSKHRPSIIKQMVELFGGKKDDTR